MRDHRNAKMSEDKMNGMQIRGYLRIAAVALLVLGVTVAIASDNPLKPGPHVIKAEELFERNTASVADRGVGLLDKGQLSDLITNFGILADYHFGTPSLHWPRNGTEVQHYGFGVNLMLLVDGTFLSSIYDQSSASTDYDFEAQDGSLGNLFNDERNEENTASDEITPLLASSDRTATWPVVDGEATWPGPFRESLTTPGEEVEGEFTSDRDVYSVFEDKRGKNIRIEQIGYSYGRPYAEDLIILRFIIHNDGATDHSEVYAGLQADLKPDFYADDRIGAWAIEPYDAGKPSVIYKQDLNGVAQRDDSSHFEENWVGPVGMIALGIVDSPDGAGITSFHYYHDDYSPVEDTDFTALLTSTPSGMEDPERYFHGTDSTFADVSLQQEIDMDEFPGSEITFTIGTGPFDIPAGGSEEFAIVIAIGEDSTDLADNLATAYQMANTSSYQGSGPPAMPSLRATAGDGYVHLVWDNVAESSIDAITGINDFEGYRLYKSTDYGETWGTVVTNWFGEAIGWEPLYQCDLVDSVTGLDPAYGPDYPTAHAWLGDDTGLQHSYIDRDVTNGVEAWYTITSYDMGIYDSDDPLSAEPSYETTLGLSSADKNTVAIVPGTRAADLTPGVVGTISEINGRIADGDLDLEVVDANELTGHTYRLTFNMAGDTVFVEGDTLIADTTTANLEDVTSGTRYFTEMITGRTFEYANIPLEGTGMPAVDGFRLAIEDVEEAGVRSMGWTVVSADTCTFDWWTENRYPGNANSYEELVVGGDDWRLTVTEDSAWFDVTAEGWGVGFVDSFKVPLMVERSDNAAEGVWEDVTAHMVISDLQATAFLSGRDDILSPYGYDLTPGGASYNPNSTGDLWPDILVLVDDEYDLATSMVYIKTQNGPDTAIAPSIGDQFTLITYKNYTSDHIYEFSTETAELDGISDLSSIKVVPNPYIVRSGLELDENDARVMFTHLPSRCTIDVYTVAGRRVNTIDHQSSTDDGFAMWDLRNSEGQDIAYGVYVYVVKAGGKTHTGKLVVIR